jgi:hypothetical protein
MSVSLNRLYAVRWAALSSSFLAATLAKIRTLRPCRTELRGCLGRSRRLRRRQYRQRERGELQSQLVTQGNDPATSNGGAAAAGHDLIGACGNADTHPTNAYAPTPTTPTLLLRHLRVAIQRERRYGLFGRRPGQQHMNYKANWTWAWASPIMARPERPAMDIAGIVPARPPRRRLHRRLPGTSAHHPPAACC